MPQITEPNIEQHILKQTERLLETSGRLFRKNGYLRTDMGDIAKAMGLARNSLYRYYPNKDHILVACIKRALAPHIEAENQILATIEDPYERLFALIDEQIDFTVGPDHIAAGFLHELRSASPKLRNEIKDLHEQMQAALKQTVGEILKDQDRDETIVVSIVLGMIQSATVLIAAKVDRNNVIQELKQSIAALLNG